MAKTQSETTKLVDRGEAAYQLERQIIEAKESIGKNFIKLGQLLKEVRDKHYYKELGYDKFTEYLSSPEVGISRSWAYDFIKIYEVLITKHKVPHAELIGIDYTKLRQILPVVQKKPDEVGEWVDKAKSLRRVDLQREIDGDKENIDYTKKVAHISVATLLTWLYLGDTQLKAMIEGKIRQATGLMDISSIIGNYETTYKHYYNQSS